VLRGGSWNNNHDNARATYRNHNDPGNRNNNIGVRLVRLSHIFGSPSEGAASAAAAGPAGVSGKGFGSSTGRRLRFAAQGNPLDHFVKRELRCGSYLRYVDDSALFSNSKRELARWRQAVIERLATLRLTVHPEGQTIPVTHGIPWLGFVVFPTHRRVKGRNVRNFTRRLRLRWRQYCHDEISFAEFDATVQGWINHVRYADTWGLREHVLSKPLIRNPLPDQPER
jgi:hypothetical protein